MIKYYEITRKNGALEAMKRVNNKSLNTPYVIEYKYVSHYIGSKTTHFVINILTDGNKMPLNFNGWKLNNPIQVEEHNWENSYGKHYFVEICIKSDFEGEHIIKMFTSYNEIDMVARVMESLGILFMCKNITDFRETMRPIMYKEDIIDWRNPITGDKMWRFSQAIKSLVLLPNSFSEKLYR